MVRQRQGQREAKQGIEIRVWIDFPRENGYTLIRTSIVIDPIKTLRSYMADYPGRFVGLLANVSVVMKELSQEWLDAGKKDWSKVFEASSDQVLDIVANLSTIRDEFDKEQGQSK